jgi:hypothetical protein
MLRQQPRSRCDHLADRRKGYKGSITPISHFLRERATHQASNNYHPSGKLYPPSGFDADFRFRLLQLPAEFARGGLTFESIPTLFSAKCLCECVLCWTSVGPCWLRGTVSANLSSPESRVRGFNRAPRSGGDTHVITVFTHQPHSLNSNNIHTPTADLQTLAARPIEGQHTSSTM